MAALVVAGTSVLALAAQAHPAAAKHTAVSHTAVAKQTAPHHASAAARSATASTTPKAAAPATKNNPAPAAAATTSSSSSSPKAAPVVTPAPDSSVSSLTPVAPTTPSSTSPSTAPSSPPTTTSYTSTNWSGYLATNGSFNAVSGSWQATNAIGISGTTSADSTWIGIGGVSTSDLIQVGTQNIIAANGQVSSSAFYELLPDFAQTVPGVTVTPGDSLTASLTEISSGQWSISITDQTNGQSYTATVAYASSNSSAEWVEEDPSYSSNRQIPFDNFQTASFSAGSTTMNGSSTTIAGSNAQSIFMVNHSGQTIAAPSALTSNGAGFTVTRSNVN